LGIDTGGTYTDAVLWAEEGGPKGKVLAKAKALTTRHDLAVGISGAVDAVLEKAGTDPASIKLVSMSTTLATNALVEGQGGRVALIMIGFSEADLARDGLK
ncbi:MAG: hydantoinase/oxoprolinase family protein, partial [Mesorhizobium sp.]